MNEKRESKKRKGEITHAKIAQTLGKAMLDLDFQEKLFSNPEKMGKELKLNESGIELIKMMDRKAFADFARNLDHRLMKDAAIIIFCAAY